MMMLLTTFLLNLHFFQVVRAGVGSVVVNVIQYVSRKSLAWDLAVLFFWASLEMSSHSQFSLTPCEQKMPSLRSLPRAAEVWAGWISFTQQLLHYREGAIYQPSRSTSGPQLFWSVSDLQIPPQPLSLTALNIAFASQKHSCTRSLYTLYSTPSCSQFPV